MYAMSGSFNLYEVSVYLTQNTVSPQILLGVTIAMAFGFLVKMAVFGVHIWLPHAHAEAPTPLSALLSPAMIGIGGYALVRIVLTLFPHTFHSIGVFLTIWALITIIYGSIMALTQSDFKRLLAYSSMSQMGYILFGIASQSLMGVSGSMFHYVAHGLSKGILFMVAGAIILQLEQRDVNRMGGLSSRMPITTISALIGFLGIIGIPPTSGFQSEWMLFSGAFHEAAVNNSFIHLLLAFGGIMATFLTACYALWTIRRIFFGHRPEHLDRVKEAPLTMTIPMLIFSVISLILGICPNLLTELLLPAISSITH
jgi:NADH-quinone oxidoreductase subunit M